MRTIVISFFWIAAAGLLGSGGVLLGDETSADRQAMVKARLQRLAVEMTESCLDDVRSLQDWEAKRPELRRQLLEMLGLDPLPERSPLNAEITGTIERPKYRIEKIVFQSMPGLYVTGNFYVPTQPSGSLPTVLYLCGHRPHPRGAKFHYQDRPVWFASHGFACLSLDTLEFGELPGIHHGTHSSNMWHWLSLGYTPAGVEVWNAIRALDYLETRPEVDGKRIGLTGISGGGAMTWYTAAVDERIAAAAPVCGTITFGSQAQNWVAKGQCDCIYYNNTYQLDFPVAGALIAPRPLLILSGQKDAIFPPDGYHEVYRRARRIYDFYEAPAGDADRLREVDDDVEHMDAPLFLKEARLWMRRWLQNDASDLPEETDSPILESAEDLACLSTVPRNAVNFRIHDQFTVTAALKTPQSANEWEARRKTLIAQLKEKVFRWFPFEKVPCDARILGSSPTKSDFYGYADVQEYSFRVEAGVRVSARLYTPRLRTNPPLIVYVKRASDAGGRWFMDEFLPLLEHYAVLVLYPRLTEQSLSPEEYADMERSSVFVGRTIASMQVWDILQAVEWAVTEQQVAANSIALYGQGEMGIICLYAGLFDDRIAQVVLNDPPGSHWQRPALLNALRVTDVPEVAAAFAPRRIVSLTDWPDSFEITNAIYQLNNASDRLVRAGSLPEAFDLSQNQTALGGDDATNAAAQNK